MSHADLVNVICQLTHTTFEACRLEHITKGVTQVVEPNLVLGYILDRNFWAGSPFDEGQGGLVAGPVALNIVDDIAQFIVLE